MGLLLLLATLYLILTTFNLTSKVSTFIANKIQANSKTSVKLRSLSAQKLQVNKDKNATSPQDQYAKWTKLNRKLDSITTEIESLKLKKVEESGKLTKLIGNIEWVLIKLPLLYWRFKRYIVIEELHTVDTTDSINIVKSNRLILSWFPNYLQWVLKRSKHLTINGIKSNEKIYSGISINQWLFLFGIVLYELKFVYEVLISNKNQRLAKPVKSEQSKKDSETLTHDESVEDDNIVELD